MTQKNRAGKKSRKQYRKKSSRGIQPAPTETKSPEQSRESDQYGQEGTLPEQPDGTEHEMPQNKPCKERAEIEVNTSDIKVWKDLLAQLQSAASQNEVVMDEVRQEVELQQQQRRQEAQALAETLRQQADSLEALIAQTSNGDLVGEEAASLKKSLEDRLASTRNLISYADQMLKQAGAKQPEEKSGAVSAPGKAAAIPNYFRKDLLLGNWIHHFSDRLFTCQSFWNDGTFKEYDFKDGSLISEREGNFEVDHNTVYLTYAEGKKAEYHVTGFSDDFIDYLIDKTPVKFDYMPENLLNSFLDQSDQAQSKK